MRESSKVLGSLSAPPRLRRGAIAAEDRAAAELLRGLEEPRIDDLAVERVWRRLQFPHPHRGIGWRSVRWVPLAGVGLLLAVWGGLIGLRTWSREAPIEMLAVAGQVFTAGPAETWRPAAGATVLGEERRVRSGPEGRALMRLSGNAALLLDEGSEVAFERLSPGTFLRLSHGTLVARVAKRKPREPFVIQTDRFRVTVVGTLFSVQQDPLTDRTSVSVREGVVEVAGAEGLVARVKAGQRWSSEAPASLQIDQTSAQVQQLLEDCLQGADAAGLAGPFAALGKTLEEPPPASPLPSGLTSAPAAAPAVLAAAPTAPPPRARPLLARRELQVPAARPALTALPAAPGPAPAVPAAVPKDGIGHAASRYDQALALESRGDFAAAAEAFEQEAASDSPQAEVALYALGRLEQRQHDARGALDSFRLYRSRYAEGHLLPEVDLSIIELEVTAHKREAAVRDSTRFLEVYASNPQVDQVRFARAGLLREAGKLAEAIGDYQQIRDPALAEEAIFAEASCQQALGDHQAAIRSLNRYVAEFPRGKHREEADRALHGEREEAF